MTSGIRDLALIALGGALGAVGRYVAGRAMGARVDIGFPWQTMVINATGALLLGLLVVAASRGAWPGWWRPFLAVGILGGYTTFSTFSLEVVGLILRGNPGAALAYASGSVVAGVAGCAAGIYLGRGVL